jgi:hypothetical protein
MRQVYSKLLGGSAPSSQSNAVQNAQSALASHGFDPGVRHGLVDIPTRNALSRFQSARKLPVTGKLDNATQSALSSQPHKRAGQSSPTSSSGATAATGSTNMGNPMSPGAQKNAQYDSTGYRVPLALVSTGTVAASSAGAISVNPQMDFRGENLVIDTTTGAQFTLLIPSVGASPQIAGAVNSAVPALLFSPAQCGALDWKMMVANQGNAISTTVNNINTTLAFTFVALLYGHEAAQAAPGRSNTTGVAPAGSFRA